VSGVDDLVQWLRAQLDEDAARAAQWHNLECEIHTHLDRGLLAAVAASQMLQDVPGAVCDCGGPAQVLREIDAKRAIVARYEFACREASRVDLAEDERETWIRVGGALQSVVIQLAASYAGRPGYKAEEWTP
jgi:hypothetical protein